MYLENENTTLQRTDEWKELRRGRFTASEVHKLMGVKGIGKTGESYVMEKVAETLGCTMPEVKTFAMERGTEMEAAAKRYYSRAFNCSVSEQPFIIAPWCDEAGASPDGLVMPWTDDNIPLPVERGIEIKAPYNPVHHCYNLTIKSQDDFKDLRTEYYWQVMMCMAVTGLKQWDFVSFYPEIEEGLAMIAVTILWDEKEIDLLKSRIFQAVELKKQLLNKIRL